jgi:hypothetical protein
VFKVKKALVKYITSRSAQFAVMSVSCMKFVLQRTRVNGVTGPYQQSVVRASFATVLMTRAR